VWQTCLLRGQPFFNDGGNYLLAIFSQCVLFVVMLQIERELINAKALEFL